MHTKHERVTRAKHYKGRNLNTKSELKPCVSRDHTGTRLQFLARRLAIACGVLASKKTWKTVLVVSSTPYSTVPTLKGCVCGGEGLMKGVAHRTPRAHS